MFKNSFNLEDASQIFVGAFALALPISFSEEAWTMGLTLPAHKIGLLFLASLVFIALYTYQSVFQSKVEGRGFEFVIRIAITYAMTALVVCFILFCLDKLPLFEDTIVAVKRVIVITLPASMGAIVVDSLDKE